jgi:ankyrin repeat protein
MLAKNSSEVVSKFPADDSERVKYSIDLIEKYLVSKNFYQLDTSLGKWVPDRYFKLKLYDFTTNQEEVRYLWTAAILLGVGPWAIQCRQNERGYYGKVTYLLGGYQYDQSGQLNPDNTFSKDSLFETKFKQHLPADIEKWKKEEFSTVRKMARIKNEEDQRIRGENRKKEEEASAATKKRIEEQSREWEENQNSIREKEEQERVEIAREQLKKKRMKEERERVRSEKEKNLKYKETNEGRQRALHDMPCTSTIRFQLDVGADINYQDHHGYSGLMIAVNQRDDHIAEYLLKLGADPLLRNKYGELASDMVSRDSPIYQLLKRTERAAELENFSPRERYSKMLLDYMGSFEIRAKNIDEYLEFGADINFQDAGGFTVLMLAVDKENERIAEYLLKRGANPLLRNLKGKSARDYSSRNSGIFELLKGYELILLTLADNLVGLQMLLNTDRSIIDFRHHFFGYTALLFAVEKGLLRLVKFLLSQGADISITRIDGDTVFDLAENDEILEVLKIAACSGEAESDTEEPSSGLSRDSGRDTLRFFSSNNIPDSSIEVGINLSSNQGEILDNNTERGRSNVE